MIPQLAQQRIHANLAAVRERIAAAAQRSGRAASDVRLIGVTKYVGAELVQALIDAGLSELGESRPQELWRKADSLSQQPLRWHLIGHLQRNKVRRTLPLVELVHSGDSLRLLTTLSEEAVSLQRDVQVLLEVNVSGDATKHGFPPQEVAAALPQIASLPHIQVVGLMTMAALEGGAERARRDFAALRELRDKLRPIAPPNVGLDELSMGMSDDFEVAIEEGSTMVRVGSALFEGLEL